MSFPQVRKLFADLGESVLPRNLLPFRTNPFLRMQEAVRVILIVRHVQAFYASTTMCHGMLRIKPNALKYPVFYIRFYAAELFASPDFAGRLDRLHGLPFRQK